MLGKSSLYIEQMYEDIPNTSFTSSAPRTTNEGPQAAPPRTLKTQEGPLQKTRKPPVDPSSSSTSLLPEGSSSKSSKDSKVKMAPFKKKMSLCGVRKSTSATTKQDSKMTSTTAVTLYGDKLTELEKTEILELPHVYFLGGDAKKVFDIDLGIKGNYGYDDEDHFYRIVPRDQVAFRYEVAEKPLLGKGTFGQVIKAFDHKDQKWVALKLVRNEKIYLNQSKEELKILQVLRKQDTNGIYNVVKLIDSFMFRNHMVFSFELLGMNLYQLLKRQQFRGFPSPRVLLVARSVLKCLELLFKNRIIHCDIKPENIMLARNGDLTSVKVGDFGSSCYEQQQKYHYIQSRYYRAPEVMLGMRYGPAIDVWSLGCVLAELAMGHPVLVGEDEEDQLAAVKEAIGDIPQSLLNKAKSRTKGELKASGRGKPGSKPLASRLEGDDLFKDAIKKMLVWDPELRPTPMEIQKHPWIGSLRASVAMKKVAAPPVVQRKSVASAKSKKASVTRDRSGTMASTSVDS